MIRILPILVSSLLVSAHGDHSFDLNDLNDAGLSYAERHMHTEHHIDSFDLESFFKLHDLDMNGFWDQAEIQAVYGLHHHSVKDKIKQPELVDARTQVVVDKVLEKLDTNKDGKISLDEFIAGGTEGLPSFEGYKDLGHHYDEESEYFLHHEELYHSSPETQTDESYTHPEDIAHFRHHAEIEDEEDARERKFEGLSEDADLSKDHVAQDPLDIHSHLPGDGPSDVSENSEPESTLKAGDEIDSPPKPILQRIDPLAQPQRILKNAGNIMKEEWKSAKEAVNGESYSGHGRPRNSEERLKAGVPYSKFTG
ncbi:uncharacterized protein I206_102726 [Kwoniella pini CBS 10737]|uniref:EF-hand domain-containing protein n=1 Tax=Kwoniella pini CBS 10737 TaxID=1296096 RepID=A0A1B9I666_9TREE|nr:uncharacterized protein I206_03081 [Kwoniella pini CBS 10737]OCF51016.1 hypothetical protein I206_03081 [Kwoniella pini CBS 10737]